jgi:AraC-like DNA-binding protein
MLDHMILTVSDVDRSLAFYEAALDEARHQMARYYLSNSVLELNEAAYLLGFEDPNSFGRAFRAWEGVLPSDWRESHRSATVN